MCGESVVLGVRGVKARENRQTERRSGERPFFRIVCKRQLINKMCNYEEVSPNVFPLQFLFSTFAFLSLCVQDLDVPFLKGS